VVNELVHWFLHEEKGKACDNKKGVARHGEELLCTPHFNREFEGKLEKGIMIIDAGPKY
jgi:hypothetical protein